MGGIFGHSFGGSMATEAARQVNDFKAMANLDGIEITRALLVDFFDHYLKNKYLNLLNKQSPDIIVKKK